MGHALGGVLGIYVRDSEKEKGKPDGEKKSVEGHSRLEGQNPELNICVNGCWDTEKVWVSDILRK